MEALPGYEARLPNEALDTMVDRVALGRFVVVVGDSVSATGSANPYGQCPSTGTRPPNSCWPGCPTRARPASRLTEAAQAVTERRTSRSPALASTDPRVPRQR
ncbi:hypothetical protein GCM10010306_087520 [Streptomyces umbrinus]|nr:hypothetical protein GCM10010306_087520 [Streptomyces umbrinus]